MKRFCGFCPGLYGDLMMMTVAARCLKRVEPDSHLTFVIAGDFREAAPLFLDHPHIDRVHILHKARDGFDEVDWAWINQQRFDHVFNPMQDHLDQWWLHRNQSLEAAHMHGLPTAGDSGKIELTRWFKPTSGLKNHIAFSPWPSFHEGVRNPKCIQPEQAQQIVNAVVRMGYSVLQVGGSTEPKLEGVDKLDTDYFSSVHNVLGCKAMIMGDSGLSWLLSGYDFPVLGLYSERYFGPHIGNIQPINPRARYFTNKTVGDISLDSVINTLTLMLS